MARPTAEDRRVDYLRVGADIVSGFGRERGSEVPLDALANVKVAEVARRAGVTKGALYHIWDSQEDYRRDLLEHLLRVEEQQAIRDVQEALRGVGPGQETVDVVHRVVEFAYQRLKDDPRTLARFSFYNYADDPEVNRLLGLGAASFGPYWDNYLAAAGRRLRAPYTLEHLVTTTTAYFYGMILRHRASPDLVEATVARDGQPWGLYAFGVVSLMEYFTEPVDDGSVPGGQARS
jgi:AcrR family transcriptional regulator